MALHAAPCVPVLQGSGSHVPHNLDLLNVQNRCGLLHSKPDVVARLCGTVYASLYTQKRVIMLTTKTVNMKL